MDLLHEGLKRSVDHDDDVDGDAWAMHDNNTLPREDDDDMEDDEIEEGVRSVDVDSMVIDVDGILLAEKKMVQDDDDNMTK